MKKSYQFKIPNGAIIAAQVAFKMEPGYEQYVPKQAHPGDAGFDVCACIPEAVVIKPGERKLISCGFSMEMWKNLEAQLRPRSGLALKHGITVLNSPGTIDCGYRGIVGAILINHDLTNAFTINPGDRIAQLIIAIVPEVTVEVVQELSETERGDGGFGSTGKS